MLLISAPHQKVFPYPFFSVDLSLEEALMQSKGGAQAEIQEGQLYQSKATKKYIWGNSLSYVHSE